MRGELYPPPRMAEALATFGTFLQIGGVALAFGGSTIFNALGIAEPFFLPFLKRNSTTVLVGLFFANSVLGSFRSTGAFEVLVDGEVVFSKLKEGRFPKIQELTDELDKRGVVYSPVD